MNAKAVGEFAHALNRLIASLAHDVCCAEFSSECDPVGMPAEDDNLLCAEAPRGDDATQADGAVSDNGHCLPPNDLGGDGRMMARPHHV